MEIVRRVHTLAERYGVKMQQIALAWEWAKGVASPIIGATKAAHFDDAAGALSVKLRGDDIAYLEEPYLPPPYRRRHRPQPGRGGQTAGCKKMSGESIKRKEPLPCASR